MLEEVRALKEEIAKVKAWETQKQRYGLVIPFTGVTVYALKKSMSDGEPPHYICANCYQDGKRSMLQTIKTKDRWINYVCSACGAEMHTGFTGIGPAKYAEEVVTEEG